MISTIISRKLFWTIKKLATWHNNNLVSLTKQIRSVSHKNIIIFYELNFFPLETIESEPASIFLFPFILNLLKFRFLLFIFETIYEGVKIGRTRATYELKSSAPLRLGINCPLMSKFVERKKTCYPYYFELVRLVRCKGL